MDHYGYFKAAAITPELHLGDINANVDAILAICKEAEPDTRLLVFPELCLCGYTCQDLLLQGLILEEAEKGLLRLCERNQSDAILVIGVPLRQYDRLFNCAAFILHHEILGIAIKSYLPNYQEFYEKRWFSPGDQRYGDTIQLQGRIIPFTPWLIIEDETTKAKIASDICEDAWVPCPPSTHHVLAGANVIVNLSASNEVIGKSDYRRQLLQAHSARCICGYVYTSSGMEESTSDLLFSAHRMIWENGQLLQQSSDNQKSRITCASIDLEKLQHERLRYATAMEHKELLPPYQRVICTTKDTVCMTLNRTVAAYPFVPADTTYRTQRCKEIIKIQASGLYQRLKRIHCQKAVIGISGGLDSTLALMVVWQAFEMGGYDPKGIIAVTMPGFGTSTQTYDNVTTLLHTLPVTSQEIDITKACDLHFQDIHHDPMDHDVTYENVQARERTQILMDLANQQKAIVIGTGDLSELALGWCTYNGDHMSMYAVNNSIPKTLVRYLLAAYAKDVKEAGRLELAKTLLKICDTPISPELLPPAKDHTILQLTEQTLGSYTYHDFFLYHMLRNAFSPKKIFYLAKQAFGEQQQEEIKKTMITFYQRFFSQQFKRNCMPDGVKVGSVSLSPRGDWRMPSDAEATPWLKEVQEIEIHHSFTKK